MRVRTADQIKKLIKTKESEIEALKIDLQIAEKRAEIAELEKDKKAITKPKRKYTRRKKAETAPTEVNPVAPAAAGGQTPDEGTPIPPKASNKLSRQRRSKAEHEPLYICKNGHKFNEPKQDGKGKAQCPECFTYDIEANIEE